jgi:hypothetical protein
MYWHTKLLVNISDKLLNKYYLMVNEDTINLLLVL